MADTENTSRRRFALRFLNNKRGNIALITAMVMIPLTFALGMAYDFTMAQSRRDQIDGMADVAALGAVTPSMMSQSETASVTQATNLFEGQIATVSGVTYQITDIVVTPTQTTSGNNVTRTVTVSYKAASQNIFATLLGMPTFPISGSSTAKSSVTPNIDFYVLLDSSPSMEIAATTSGIATMVSNTSSQGGCAFGCHESDPAADNLGNPGGEDNYQLARNLGVSLRIDLVNQAVQNLMDSAATTESVNNATYRAAIYTMDYNLNTLKAMPALTSPEVDDLTAAKTAAANIASVEVYNNNCLTSTNCNNDQDSYLDNGLSGMNTAMPNPGSGTNNAGDTPQEVLFIVSDGVIDESLSGSRTMAPINTKADWCDTIKNRGIRIAFLYTTYNPLPTNSFYNTYVKPFQPNVAADAQACASPGLFFQVSTDGDISAALEQLFQEAVATARLTS